MTLIEVNWNPTDRQLRQFSAICFFAAPFVGWMWGASGTVVSLLGLVGLVLAILGMMRPRSVKPVFLALVIAATPFGIVMGEVAMLLIFFCVFLPIGLIFRMLRRDVLELKIQRQAVTYWRRKKQPNSVANYYRQS